MSLPSISRFALIALALCSVLCFSAPVSAGGTFIRGDSNGDGDVQIVDAILSLSFLFLNGNAICLEALDINDDSDVGIVDPILLLTRLFLAGPPPPYPFPICGLDTTGTALGCDGPIAACQGGGTLLFPEGVAPTFPVGLDPASVALGDLDGDGDLDACVGNQGSGNVSVLLNQGNGTFLPSTQPTFPAGDSPQSVTLGDLDGDGDLDVCTTHFFLNIISVHLNQGGGTFLPSTPPTFAVGNGPRSVTLGDLDGDGDLDACVANASSNNVSVLLNLGGGTFAPTSPPTFAVGNFPGSVTIGDLDGDGDLDAMTSNVGSNNVSVLLNLGSGTFPPATTFAVGDGPFSVSLGDLDGDGDLDAMTGNFGSDNVSVLLNLGSGTFLPATPFAVGDAPEAVTLGDLDGDGDLDAMTANRFSNNVSALLNQGNGTFLPSTPSTFAVGNTPVAVTLGDLDGDGDLDACVANFDSGFPSGNVSVLLNQGAGPTLFPAGIALSFAAESRPYSVTLGDLDGDGDLDACVANLLSDNVSVLLNQGNGTFLPSTPPTFAVGDQPVSVTVGDLDGDGDLDSCVANRGSGNVSVLLNEGNGTFLPATTIAVGDSPRSVTLGDLDGDGDLDAMIGNFGPDNVSVLLNQGNGTFLPATPFAAGDGPFSVALGDLDGDGDLDACVANGLSDNVSVLLNQGSGTFLPGAVVPVGEQPRFITLGDLDCDGDLDACVANEISHDMSILLNQGNGTFLPVTITLAVGFSVRSVTLGDLDGDGDLDACVCTSPNTVRVLLSLGDGTFVPSSPPTFTVDANPLSVTLGDLDGDGDLDVCTANFDSDNISVRLNQIIP